MCASQTRATLLGRHHVSFFCKLLNEPTACSQDVALIVFSEIFQMMVRNPPPWPLARPAVLLSLGCYCVLARALCPMFLEAQRAILTRCPPYELTCVCPSAGWEASRLLNGRRSIAAIAPHNYIRSTLSARATSARASSARSPLRPTLLWLALLLLALLPLALPPLRCSAARSLRRHSLHRPLPRSTVGLLPSTASLAPLPRADCRLHAPFKQHDAVGAPLAL
jgi:hypothetical protein